MVEAMHFPLSTQLRPSRGVMASILVAHVAAGSALFYVPSLSVLSSGALPMLGVLLWICVLASFLVAIRHERAKQGLNLVFHGDGGLSVVSGEKAADYWLGAGAVDFGWAVWLPLVEPVVGDAALSGRTRLRLMLLRANLPPSHWRPLRIWLRHKAAPFRSD